MIIAGAAKRLADSYAYQRDRRYRTSQEAERLENAARALRERLSHINAAEKASYEAFEQLFNPIRLLQPKGRDWHYPHCDSWVLHAPGKCEYCDMCPEAQALRVEYGVCFTGQPEAGKCPCPSELLRGLAVIEAWGGNVAKPKES